MEHHLTASHHKYIINISRRTPLLVFAVINFLWQIQLSDTHQVSSSCSQAQGGSQQEVIDPIKRIQSNGKHQMHHQHGRAITLVYSGRPPGSFYQTLHIINDRTLKSQRAPMAKNSLMSENKLCFCVGRWRLATKIKARTWEFKSFQLSVNLIVENERASLKIHQLPSRCPSARHLIPICVRDSSIFSTSKESVVVVLGGMKCLNTVSFLGGDVQEHER